MFNKKEIKTDDSSKLEDYLMKINYHQINTAKEYYLLALNGLEGYAFKQDKDLILKIISVIAGHDGESFKDQFKFAEKLYEIMSVSTETEENIYLANLDVCLDNPSIMENYDNFADLYLLFENKMMVSRIIEYANKMNYSNYLMEYIKKSRMYYVNEEEFYSSILMVIDRLLDAKNEDEAFNIIKEKFQEDRQNAGIYDFDPKDIRKYMKLAASLDKILDKMNASKGRSL